MQEPQQRQMVFEELRVQIGSVFASNRGLPASTWGLLTECLKHDGGLAVLVAVVAIPDGDTSQFQRLSQIVNDIPRTATIAASSTVEHEQQPVPPSLVTEHSSDADYPAVLREVGRKALTAALETPKMLEAAKKTPPEHRESAVDIYLHLVHENYLETASDFLAAIARQLDLDRREALLRYMSSFGGITAELQSELESNEATQIISSESEAQAADGEIQEAGDVDVSTAQLSTIVLGVTAQRSVPAIWGGIPPRNHNFVGREALLETIRQALQSDARAALLPQSLYGLGGVGKSQVAIEYAYANQDIYDLVWWIPSDDERTIRRSLVSLAKRLRLRLSEDVDDTILTVLDSLRIGDPYARWLLIFDNAGEPSVVLRYIPAGRGHVIVTSRSRTWASETDAVEVDVFTPVESATLLERRWPDLSKNSAIELADRLGHLPLALEQAAAVHSQTGMPITDYISALSRTPGAMLREGIPPSYVQSVSETLGLAVAKLTESSPISAVLLELCCLIGPQPISIPLLSRGRSERLDSDLQQLFRDEISIRTAVRDLGRFALAKLDSTRDLLSIHNLVRDIIRDGLSSERSDSLSAQAQSLLQRANPGQPDTPATWPLHAQITPHIRSSGILYSNDDDSRQTILDQVRYLYVIGDYSASRDLAHEAIENWSARFGADDPLTLVGARHLGNALRATGANSEAHTRNEDTLERMRRVLGENHEHTLATANSFAADLRLQGRLQEAHDLDIATLERHRDVLGQDDPATLRVMGNLAVDYRLLGNFERAAEVDEESISRRTAIYGDEHSRTLFAYMSFVRDLYGLGHYQDALRILQQKLPVYESILPEGHVDTLLARRLRAMLLRKRGHYGRAYQEADELLSLHQKAFGHLHEHTQAAAMTLVNCMLHSGDAEAALDLAQATLTAYRQQFGDRHPFTLACRMTLGVALARVGHLDDGLLSCSAALDDFESILGPSHAHTLCCTSNKASILSAMQKTQNALELDMMVLRRSQEARPQGHPNTLLSAANYAVSLDQVGKANEANRLRREAIAGLRVALGSDNPELTRVSMGDERLYLDVEVSTS